MVAHPRLHAAFAALSGRLHAPTRALHLHYNGKRCYRKAADGGGSAPGRSDLRQRPAADNARGCHSAGAWAKTESRTGRIGRRKGVRKKVRLRPRRRPERLRRRDLGAPPPHLAETHAFHHVPRLVLTIHDTPLTSA